MERGFSDFPNKSKGPSSVNILQFRNNLQKKNKIEFLLIKLMSP